MVSLITQQERRASQNLPFCYLCGKDFVAGDDKNKDHVPPKSIFAAKDRDPLMLKSHKACNEAQSRNDEKIGQLIALRYGKLPVSENRRLQFRFSQYGDAAISNLNVEKAIWRWIGGFHAALYHISAVGIRGSLATPFIKAKKINGGYTVQPLRPQHATLFRRSNPIVSGAILIGFDAIRES
jgi:hypothetical protein